MRTALFVFLCSVYFLSYTGLAESGDSERLFDGMTSMVDHGDLLLDGSADSFPADAFDDPNGIGLANAAVEPMQMVLSAPLYLLARFVPGFGAVHTVWLFNILVSAATAVLLFDYALRLGYRDCVALGAAFAFGLTTAWWVYSATFFREPLTGFFLLLTAFCLETARQRHYRAPGWLAACLLALLGLVLTKASGLLAVPALVLLILPARRHLSRRLVQRVLIPVGVVLALLAGLYLLLGLTGGLTGFAARYNIFTRLDIATTQNLAVALGSYLLSPGASLWATSPVLLLGLAGAVMLVRGGHLRYGLTALVLTLSFAIGYALLNGPYWFGGLSWPPRFLVPLIPFLMLLTLPVFERLAGRSSWAWLPVGVLLAYGLWTQICGVSLPWGAYANALPAEANGFLDWPGASWEPAWFRTVITPGLWATERTEIAWLRFNLPFVGIVCLLACGLTLLTLLRIYQRKSGAALMLALSAASISLVVGLTLATLYRTDERYRAWDSTLFDMLGRINASARPGDIVLLSSPSLQPFFANYGHRLNGARGIALPLQPGERPSPEQPAEISSPDADRLLLRRTAQLIGRIAALYPRAFVLVDGGPDLWWTARPVERYMHSHYYPGQVIATGPITRLIPYTLQAAPTDRLFDEPVVRTDLVYDGFMALAGITHGSTTLRPGETFTLSLLWEAETPTDRILTTAVYIRDASGLPVAQIDAPPAGGFPLTSLWTTGSVHWDHHALEIPAGLAPGRYQVWVKLYDFGPDGAPRDLPVTGENTLDGVIGVLPLSVTVPE